MLGYLIVSVVGQYGHQKGQPLCPDGTPFCRDGTLSGTLFYPDGTPFCPDGTRRDTNGHQIGVLRRYSQALGQ